MLINALYTIRISSWLASYLAKIFSIRFVRAYELIKTHGRGSVAKKDVWHTIVLFTGTTKSLFSTPHTSITTEPISIKFIYFMPSIYTTYIPNLTKIG